MAEKVKRRRGVTRVSPKHQITIPVAALREAHLEVGDELEVTVDAVGQLRLTAVRSRFDAIIGAAPGISCGAAAATSPRGACGSAGGICTPADGAEREEAAEHCKAALAVEGVPDSVKTAAEKGLKEAFNKKQE